MDEHPDRGLKAETLRDSTAFLHHSLAEVLRRRVATGALAGGAKLPPLREIADEFDVSTMTVRQAIRLLEQEGHVYRIAGVGAFVRAPSEKAATRKMLAFSATDLRSNFEMGIARGIERACLQRGWTIQLFDAGHDPDLERRNIRRVLESGSQGTIVIPTWGEQRCVETLFEVQARGFPMVVADRVPPGITADLVESNHEQGAYLATSHLLEHGHSHVLILTPEPKVSSLKARIHGYEHALQDAGLEPKPEWYVWVDLATHTGVFHEDRKWLGGYTAVLPVLKKCKCPVAVFAIDPYTTWGVYEACRELGLRIPDQVSVVGFDDSEIALAMRPPITVVAQRTNEIGRLAVELLERRISEGFSKDQSSRIYHHAVIDVDLIERDSVADVTGSQ